MFGFSTISNAIVNDEIAIAMAALKAQASKKKLPKNVVSRHFRVVRFSDGLQSKLTFDRMQNGDLHIHAPGRVAVKICYVGGWKKPFRATISNKQKRQTNVGFGMGGGATERDAYRNLVGSFARVMGW